MVLAQLSFYDWRLTQEWGQIYTTAMLATFATKEAQPMPELSTVEAGRVVSMDRETLRRWCVQGLLPARRFGLRGQFRIEVDNLRSFAQKYNYSFDEELATQLAK